MEPSTRGARHIACASFRKSWSAGSHVLADVTSGTLRVSSLGLHQGPYRKFFDGLRDERGLRCRDKIRLKPLNLVVWGEEQRGHGLAP
jgi:hypothetical protein